MQNRICSDNKMRITNSTIITTPKMSDYRDRSIFFPSVDNSTRVYVMDDDNGKLDENLTFFSFPPMKLFLLPLPWTTTGKMEKK